MRKEWYKSRCGIDNFCVQDLSIYAHYEETMRKGYKQTGIFEHE